jgi:hypothetical protein
VKEINPSAAPAGLLPSKEAAQAGAYLAAATYDQLVFCVAWAGRTKKTYGYVGAINGLPRIKNARVELLYTERGRGAK